MTYSVDTSALLDGWVRYYPPDVFPLVWERLTILVGQGTLIATEEVLHELERKDDSAYGWARERSMFVATDEEIQTHVIWILTAHPRLVDNRLRRSGCDPFVIALARARGCAVLTGETRTNNPDKPKIPDVCDALGIRCVNMLQLFRDQGWVFR